MRILRNLAYDADGNTTRRGSQYLTFDAYNRVTCTGSSPGSCSGARLRYTVDGEIYLMQVGGEWRTVMGDLFEWDDTTNTATAHVFAFGQEIAVRTSANATLRGAWLPPGFRLPVPPTVLGLGLGFFGLGALLAALARLGAYGQIARHPAASATSLVVIVTLVPLPAWAGGAPQFGNGGNTWVPRWVVNDHLGNAVLFVTEAGAEVKRRVFDPFGALIAQSETTEATARQFTGQSFEDSMGLYDFKARWYDPETGRFLSVDPLVQNPFDPQVLNPYGYVRNNPLNFVDPTGMTIMFAGINFGFGMSLTFGFGGIAAGQSGGESSPSSGGKGNKHPPDGRGQSGPTLGSWEGEVAKGNSDALHRQWKRALDTIVRALRSATDMTLDIGPGFSLGGRGGGGGREESQGAAPSAARDGSFNPVKFAVGAINIARGGLSIIRGAEAPEAEDPNDLNLPRRILQFGRGLGSFRRGLKQTKEALDDPNGPSPRNLLGLLPFGQLFDDPLEPTPLEFGAERLRMLRRDLPGTAKRLLREYFVFDEPAGQQP